MTACFCTGACRNGGRCPAAMSSQSFRTALLPDEKPGFHDVKAPEVCRDSAHGVPSMLHVPSGQRFVHYCPSCGQKSVVYGASYSF